MFTPWLALPHGLNQHQSETNPIKRFPELGVSSMIHSHSFFLSLLPAKKLIIADEENKGTSIFREVILISLSLSLLCSLTRIKTLPHCLPGHSDKSHLDNGATFVLPVVRRSCGTLLPPLCWHRRCCAEIPSCRKHS